MPTAPLTEFAFRLQIQRDRAGQPPERAIGEAAGVTHVHVGRTLNGQSIPSWETAERIITFLGGTPADFRNCWEAAGRGEHLAPLDRMLLELDEGRRFAEQAIQRLDLIVSGLTIELLRAGDLPGFGHIGEYRTGVEFGAPTVWHAVPDCDAKCAYADPGELLTWIGSHQRDEHDG